MREPVADRRHRIGRSFLKADLRAGRVLLRCFPLASLTTTTRRCLEPLGVEDVRRGLFPEIVFPANLVSAGFGSKLSMWLYAAAHEEPDHAFGLGGEMRLAVGRRPRARFGSERVALQETFERKQPAAAGKPRDESAPIHRLPLRHRFVPLVLGRHRIVTKSL